MPLTAPLRDVRLPDAAPGLDMPRALRNVGGDPRLLARLLRDLLADHGDDGERIALALKQGEIGLAQRLAHTLKGLAGTLGATPLHDSARALEQALRAQAPTAEPAAALQEALVPLMQSLRRWQQDSSSELQPAAADTGPTPDLPGAPMARTPSPWADMPLHNEVVRLQGLLVDGDIAAVELAESVLAQALANPASMPWADAAEALCREAQRFNFKAALEHCRRVREALTAAPG